jgi:hypothetical protein
VAFLAELGRSPGGVVEYGITPADASVTGVDERACHDQRA